MSIPSVHCCVVVKNPEDQLVIEELNKKYAEELSVKFKNEVSIGILAFIRYSRRVDELEKKLQSYLVSQKHYKKNDLIQTVVNRTLLKKNLESILQRQISMSVDYFGSWGTYGSVGTCPWIVIQKIPNNRRILKS
jgi:hypothetical protein